MNDLIQQLLPAVLSLVGFAALAAIGAISMKLNKKFAVEIEQGKKVIESFDRDALHKAMATAATVALSRGLIGEDAMRFILRYVGVSVPDALLSLSPDTQVLRDIAMAKLAEASKIPVAEILAKTAVPVLDAVSKIPDKGDLEAIKEIARAEFIKRMK